MFRFEKLYGFPHFDKIFPIKVVFEFLVFRFTFYQTDAQRVAAKRSGGFGTLNCLNAQCLLVAQLFIFALRPPFFLGAVSGSLFSVYMVITCPPILSVYLIF
jgi:hypothetical protein